MAKVAKHWSFLLILGFTAFWFACQEEVVPEENTPEEPVTGVRPPSELALLMKSLYADFEQAAETYHSGEYPAFQGDYQLDEIYTATPTDSTVHSPAYEAFTYAFIQRVQEYVTLVDPEQNDKVLFNSMIDGCIDCHQTFCPGPIRKIQKLHLPDSVVNL